MTRPLAVRSIFRSYRTEQFVRCLRTVTRRLAPPLLKVYRWRKHHGFFLHFRHTAAYLGVKGPTLYAWAPYMESAEKRGANLIFKIHELVNSDIPELENKLPSREEILADRDARVRDGEVMRRGRHIAGCLKAHEGPCIRRQRPDDPRRTSQAIRRRLGKKPKK
jgi:hypothetical protein